jgi:cell division protein FtsZ
MSINIGPPVVDELKPKIAVIGVGGAGGNAIANMINARVEGVDFIVANTDAQALNSSPAEFRIQLGPDITQGLGAGSRPEVGRAAAEETLDMVKQALSGAHMCFIAAGMGGGTGTGAAPVIARAAREMNILTVGVVTKPFLFEGQRRMRSCEAGIEELQQHVDTLIVIPNQNLFLVANPNTTFKEAFLLADEVLQQGVRGITDLMVMPGLINLDFADVRSVMHEMGKAMMGTGEADGDGRALEAAERAISNPLLDGVSMQGAKGVIISITGGDDMRLMEVDEAANRIRELVDSDANIIWGSAFNENLNGKIRVSVVATGIDQDAAPSAQPARSFSFDSVSRPAPLAAAAAPVVEEAVADPVEEVASSIPTGYGAEAEIEAAQDEALELGVAEAEAAQDDEPLELGAAHVADSDGAGVTSEAVEASHSVQPAYEDTSDLPREPSSPPPRVSTGGGTLFERMTNLSRGLSRDDDEDDNDGGSAGLNIPRFLDRQSNN